MTDIPIVGQNIDGKSKSETIDKLTAEVVELLEQMPLGEGELIGIVELSMLDTISNLAGYVYEMQKQILNVLGAIPEVGAPTAQDFAGSYIEDYTLLRISRTASLLRSHVADFKEAQENIEDHNPKSAYDQLLTTPGDLQRAAEETEAQQAVHDEHAAAREVAVHDALDEEEAEVIAAKLREEGHDVKVVSEDDALDAERDDGG